MRDLRKDFMKYFGEEDSFAVIHLSTYKTEYSVVYEGITLRCDGQGYVTNIRMVEGSTLNELKYVANTNNAHFENIEQLPTYKLRFPNEFRGLIIHLKTNETFYIT